MSHYAIIKRQRYWVTPEWKESYEDIVYFSNVIKYETKKSSYPISTWKNAIIETKEKDETIVYWEGDIYQEILKKGEFIVIGEESFEISKVEKHELGNITYYVDALYAKVKSYDELLAECEKKYEEKLKLSFIQEETVIDTESNETGYSPYDELFNEMRKQVILEESKKPWWKRIFS